VFKRVAIFSGNANGALTQEICQALEFPVGKSKVYGDVDPRLTYTVGSGNLIGSDTISGALVRVAGENVGSYAIKKGTLSAGGNYAINFVGANLAITQRALTITADNISKVYGRRDPDKTYTIGGSGLVGADSLSGRLGRAKGRDVGSYAIKLGTLTAGSNYALTFVGANFKITARELTVKADRGQGKIKGHADPVLTYTFGKLQKGNSITGELTRKPGEKVGLYPIRKGSISAGMNYVIDFISREFRITKAD